jgi:hypothetical protein
MTVGKLVCVIVGTAWSGQISNKNRGKPSPGSQTKPREWAEGSVVTPRGKEGQSILLARQRWTPSRGAVETSSEVRMNVIQQIHCIACKIE